MAKTKTCRNCGWFKKDCGEVHRNFYLNCTNPEMKKGTACGPDSSEPFRYHKSRKLLGILGMMELTRMDKAMLFVFAMFVIVEISFAVAIIMGVKDPGSWAFGIIVVMVIDAWLTTSYLRHRHEYR